MPIHYICKNCSHLEPAQVLYTTDGEPRLMPPYRWQAVEENGTPDVLCPRCAREYNAANPPEPPKKPPRPFGVIDGGKTE